MLIAVLLACIGLVVLAFAADHLVLGSSRIAASLRMSPVVVGVVVIGLGTSAPEFLVSGLAAARGDLGIATGNIVGSNILNVTLVLGLAALVAPVSVASSVVRREVRLSLLSVLVFAVAAAVGLSWWTAAALTVAATVALWRLVRWARQGNNTEVGAEALEFAETAPVVDVSMPPVRPLVGEVIRAVLGLAGVLAGAQLLVVNASSVAQRLGVSQIVIGLTLVALGTSLPELVTTVMAQRRGETDLVVGNLFGSNLFNSLAGGAVIGFAAAGGSTAKPSAGPLAAMALAALIAWGLLRRGLRLTRGEGAVLLVAYLASLPVVLLA
jgi:cation:H+ antiporter